MSPQLSGSHPWSEVGSLHPRVGVLRAGMGRKSDDARETGKSVSAGVRNGDEQGEAPQHPPLGESGGAPCKSHPFMGGSAYGSPSSELPHPCVSSGSLSCSRSRGQEHSCKAKNIYQLALYRKSLPGPTLDFNRPEPRSRSCPFYLGDLGQATFVSEPRFCICTY